MIRTARRFLLAGTSALAILSAAEAEADTYTIPGSYTFTTTVAGEYFIEVAGAKQIPRV
jgi:hypothetical protein